MNMKKYIILAAAICTLASCGRTVTTKQHDADKRSFDAWVHVQKEQHPEYLWKQTELGSWLLEETVGTGELLDTSVDTVYVRVNYTNRSTSGTITSTSLAGVAQQLGTYSESAYYGPEVWYAHGTYAAFEELLNGMRDGGRRKAAVPGWLITYARYDSPDKYLNDSTSHSPAIVELELVEHFRRPNEWELDSIARYLVRSFPGRYGTVAKARADSSGTHGFYYITTKAPSDYEQIKDSTVYINYTGRLLSGKVFDTTIRDTAIFHGIYNSSKDYKPVSIRYGTKWSDIKMGSSSVVEGFARTLSKMHAFEQGTGIFYSPIGYSTKGSGTSIPGYAPLRFDIELVKKP